MKNIAFHKTRLLTMAILVVVISLPSVSMVRASGNLLRGFDVPATTPFNDDTIYWPVGVAFDGTNLWYSQPSNITADIFLTTTTGHLLRTLNVINQAGALAWDGTYLWVGIFANNVNSATCVPGVTGCALLYQVDVHKNKVVKTVDISPIFAADQECNFISGLAYDGFTGSLWVAPNVGCGFVFTDNPCGIGFVYNVDTSGHLLKRIQEPFGVFGVSRVGSHLYMVTCKTLPTQTGRPIIKTNLNGTPVSNFTTVSVSGNRESAESIAFDSNTFGNACALWVNQNYGIPFDASLAAYKIPCPQNDQEP